MNSIAMFLFSALLPLLPGGPAVYAAEFEILDRFSVDGYTVLRSSADIPGGSFTVGVSTFVVKSGNVGIGTTSPGANLHILKGSDDAKLLLETTGGANYSQEIHFKDTASDWYVGNRWASDINGFGIGRTNSKDDLVIGSNGGVGIGIANPTGLFQVGGGSLTVLANGNVGIGTTEPGNMLAVSGALAKNASTGTGWGLVIIDTQTMAAGVGGGIYFQGYKTGTSAFGNFAAIAGVKENAAAADEKSALLFYTDTGSGILSEVMRVTSGGNFGLGTGNPHNKLTAAVTGTAAGYKDAGALVSIFNSNDAVNSQYFGLAFTQSNTPEGATQKSLASITAYARGGSWNANWAGDLVFSTANGSASAEPAENMRITSGGNVGIGTTNPAAALHVGGTGAVIIPVGSTAERPSAPVAGMMRFNNETGKLEYYYGGWYSVSAVRAVGGTITDVGGYRFHTFTGSDTFTITQGGEIEVLMVGGGGGGGRRHGGGGGAGGLVVKSAQFLGAGSYPVIIGGGGAGATGSTEGGARGSNSTFNNWIAYGGGGGWSDGGAEYSSGGSGGGAEHNRGGTGAVATQPGSATGGYGNNGGPEATSNLPYQGSGGGGAGTAGVIGIQGGGTGNGGDGRYVSQFTGSGTNSANGTTGTRGYYAGGGGSGTYQDGSSPRYGSGGVGGGGNGGAGIAQNSNLTNAAAGQNNTGGGGGGDGADAAAAGAGGSGIVIIRYPI